MGGTVTSNQNLGIFLTEDAGLLTINHRLHMKGKMKMDNHTYLPIGSVVALEGQNKRVMIDGRRIRSQSEGKEYNYRGCLYPEGIRENGDVILFNNEDISMVYFIGFQDIEELAFRKMVLKNEDMDGQKE